MLCCDHIGIIAVTAVAVSLNAEISYRKLLVLRLLV
jgi:hypothetical protein